MTTPHQSDIVVVGAGIVGISVALALQARGRRVIVLDRSGTISEAAAGNAGAFAFADIVPLATPGIVRKAPRWLLDPMGPLSIPPRYALKIVPWLLRFWRASRRDRVERSMGAQAALMRHSQACLSAWLKDIGGEALIREEGQIALYEAGRQADAGREDWRIRQRQGVEVRLLEGPEAISQVQPGLSARFVLGAYTPEWINATDPARFARHLAQTFVDRGGRIDQGEVEALSSGPDSVTLRPAGGTAIRAGTVVVCAGAWSHRLARTLGDRIPLESERGYNTTLPAGAFDLRTHLTFPDHGFVVTRIGDGVRVGGAVELGGLTLPPDYRRADAMLSAAKTFLPELKTGGGRRWMGFRPSLPDSLPVIDRSPSDRRVVYAFGHGHLGLTQSAGTADLVADLATGNTPAIDIASFRADRFKRVP